VNLYLELLLYQNRLQLATQDALYSDGTNYKPVSATVKHLRPSMRQVKRVLALGTGLGSIVQIIRAKGYNPHFTLVELDKIVLQWAMEFMGSRGADKLRPVCADAGTFMGSNTELFDLVFIDIFNSRSVPVFVRSAAFLLQCKAALAPGGHVAFNYMIDDPVEWIDVQDVFTAVFPDHKILDLGINRILIGSGSPTSPGLY